MEILLVLLGLVALATVLGLVWRAQTGRVKRTRQSGLKDSTAAVDDSRITIDGAAPFGSRVTLLQFSTATCSICPTTRAQLSALAAELDDGTGAVVHVEVDVTSRPEIANKFKLLQSPTTFILDGDGVLHARIGGAPKINDVRAELHRMLAPALV